MNDFSTVAQASAALPSVFTGVRVLDLSGPFGNYCGKLFADMGADVILVEPPGGTGLRFEPPFLADSPGLERSLSFAYFNTSKRSITLAVDTPEGQDLLRRLVANADIVIETEKPGVMQERGLSYDALAGIKPSLIMTSITPFGQTGPYAQYEAEDLTLLALGGLLYLAGYPDTAPTRVYGNQAYMCASMYAAVGSLLALLAAEQDGVGEHVDVAAQECVVLALENSVQFYDLEGIVRKRHAGAQRFAGTGIFACSDGFVFLMAAGIGANKFWPHSLQWLIDEKVPGVERLRGAEWHEPKYLESDEAKKIFSDVFTAWALTKTKVYLYKEGQSRRIPIAPVNAPADLLANRQLDFRKYFVKVPHPLSGDPLVMPGAPYQLSETPWRIQRPAPRLGEHNAEVYAEIGLDRAQLAALCAQGIL